MVIDPNVWVAALINPYGTPARVVAVVMAEDVTAVLTQQLLDELARLRPATGLVRTRPDSSGFVPG